MKRYKLISSLALVLLLGMSINSLAITYDFNSVSTGTHTEAAFSALFLGVSFDNFGGTGFTVNSSAPGAPLSGRVILNSPYNGTTTRATFDILSTFVSVDLGDYDADAETFWLKAYDSVNTLVDSDSYNQPDFQYGGATISVAASDIAWVEFYSSNINSAYWDNFTFQPVPEPATMLLLGSGLFGLAGFRRKFRKR